MMDISELRATQLNEWLVNIGFDFWGLTEVSSFPECTDRYRQWLEHQQHGTMDYLERHLPFKYNPVLLLKDCQSLLMVGLNYFQPFKPIVPSGYGQVALYAWGRDYHKVLQYKLKQLIAKLQALNPEAVFLAGVDATSLSESHFAERAGLGWRGKNTLIINANHGSWFVVGEILSTVPFTKLQEQLYGRVVKKMETDKLAPGDQPDQAARSCPAGCKLCQNACPTKALHAPYQLDARRCISYLTIEYKSEIAPEIWPDLQDWVFGCDICQRVCPFNKQGVQTKEHDFLRSHNGGLLALACLLNIKNAEEYQKLFAGSPLMRAGRSRLLRNAIIAAVNSQARELKPFIKQLSSDEEPLLAWHARQAECFF